jgi:acetyl-CoA carboxylase carboxyltransferase component
MLIIFKSKAAAEVIMYEEHAKPILDLLGKEAKRGVITAEEAPGAIARLESEIAQRRQAAEADQGAQGADEHEQALSRSVSFATRVYPLLEMLRAAVRKKQPVAWGI